MEVVACRASKINIIFTAAVVVLVPKCRVEALDK